MNKLETVGFNLPEHFSLKFAVKNAYYGRLGHSPITLSVLTLRKKGLITGTNVEGLETARAHLLLPRPDLHPEVFTKHLELAKAFVYTLTNLMGSILSHRIKDFDFDPNKPQYPSPTFFIDRADFVRQPPKDFRDQVAFVVTSEKYMLPNKVIEIMHPTYFQ